MSPRRSKRAVKNVPGVTSALAERLTGGRYIDVDARSASRPVATACKVADVQSVVASAIGGENIGETVEGRQRFPINVRYPREYRDSLERLRALPIVTERGAQIRLGGRRADRDQRRTADAQERERPALRLGLRRHPRSRSALGRRRDADSACASEVKLPPGYSIAWSGQFEYLERATQRLKVVVPATLAVIFLLLFLTFRRVRRSRCSSWSTVPFALVGGFWLIWLLGHDVSVASAVGFIALAGVAAEFGVVMLVYLKQRVGATAGAGASRVRASARSRRSRRARCCACGRRR